MDDSLLPHHLRVTRTVSFLSGAARCITVLCLVGLLLWPCGQSPRACPTVPHRGTCLPLALTFTAEPSQAAPGPPLPPLSPWPPRRLFQIHCGSHALLQLSLSSTPLGSLLSYRPHIAACSSVIGPNFEKPRLRVLKTGRACAVGYPRNQGISVQSLALLASPLVGCHHAHLSLSPTAV